MNGNQIRVWDTRGEKCAEVISSLGGYVYSVAVSEMSPTKVALGVGDNTIRVWQPFTMPGVWEACPLYRHTVSCRLHGFIYLCQGPFRLAKKPELGPIIYWKRKVGTVTEKIGVENFRIGYDVRYFGFE
jgi:hypothetical protein